MFIFLLVLRNSLSRAVSRETREKAPPSKAMWVGYGVVTESCSLEFWVLFDYADRA
jgi:hypothetical protein